MKLNKKHVIIPMLAAVTAFSLCLTAYAADDRKKIERVKLTVDCGSEPEAGEDVGSVQVTVSSSSAVYQVDTAEYYNTRDDEWERGEVPVIRVELSVKDDEKDAYRFSSTSKSNFTISGYHSQFKAAKVLDSGDGLRVDIKLRAVGGDLDTTDDLYWSGRTAKWEEVEDADKYEVKLYRNGSSVTTVTSTNEQYYFYPYMTKAGDYTFKIRAISNSDGEKSEWSDESDEYYLSSGDVYTGAAPTTDGTGSTDGTGGPSNLSGSGWAQDQTGWVYNHDNGTRAQNSWIYVDNNWFYMGSSTYMMTGWIYVDNNWFYLNPISDGTKGAMLSGWQTIDGVRYYLNPVSDGTKGARKTSYQMVDGNWYFFDLTTGAMWANRAVPNGKWADANGVIH